MPDLMTLHETYPWLLSALVGGYLLGSVPFGLLLTRLAGLGDIRSIGSGNIGATNVLRTGRKGVALLTLVLDGGKGTAAVLIAEAVLGHDPALMAAAGALLGHIFPVWLGFRGGKGVATALGVLLGLSFTVGVIACAVWLLTAFLFRYSSLAALVAVGTAPVFAFLLDQVPVVEMCGFIAVLVFARHHGNIRRLLGGTESRINLSRGQKPPVGGTGS